MNKFSMERNAHRMVIDQLSLVLDRMTSFSNKHMYLSLSPHLRYSDVAANKTADWDWQFLSANAGIILQDILSHPDDPWQWVFRSNVYNVSMNPSILLHDVLQHLDKPWDWFYLSANETVTIDIVLAHLNRPWSWRELSKNSGIRWSDIQAHPNLPWVFHALSQRPISSEQIVILNDNFDKWDWSYLSRYASFELIRNYPDWPWNWDGICRNSNVPSTFIPAEHRNYSQLSFNPKISIQDILDHLDAGWSWGELSANINFQNILDYPELPWNFYRMSQNPGLRLDYVMSHLEKWWNLFDLSQNSFTADFTDYYTQMARQHLAALKIQLYWRKYATDHRYLICHRVQLCRMNEI